MPPCLLVCVHVDGRVLSCVDGSACGALSKRGVAPMARSLTPFYTFLHFCIKIQGYA